jgi:hypothetical protein
MLLDSPAMARNNAGNQTQLRREAAHLETAQ